MDVVVEGAHLRIGQPIHDIGEHPHHLHQRVARHAQCEGFCHHMQRGNVCLGAGSDVVPAEDFGKFGHHIVIDTKLTGGSSEIGGGISGRMELVENSEQIALAGGHRRELIVADTAGLCELDQPQPMQRIGFEFSIRLPMQQADVDVPTKTTLGLTGYRGQFVQTPGPGHQAMLQAMRQHDVACPKGN